MKINYKLLNDAVHYYSRNDFVERDVPWIVSPDAAMSTLPVGATALSCEEGFLVGSAEQSFIHMMLNGNLARGKWSAISPCFRVENEYTETTRLSFMKLELINYFGSESADVQKVIDIATLVKTFMDNYVPVNIVQTGEHSYDIVDSNNLELGSYGVRSFRGHNWIYGTGLAEPRFSVAIRNSR